MKYDSIDIFNNKYKLLSNNSKIIVYWIMILIVLILIFINIAFNYRFNEYDKYIGYVQNSDVVVYTSDKYLYKYNLLVNNKNYSFKIKNISEEYYIVDGKKNYQFNLEVNLDSDLNIENNILDITFIKNKTTIYQILKKEMLKWIN